MNLVQDSPEWAEWRKGGIGASEIAGVMGICPYNTPHSIWLVKTGRSKGFEGNSFTEHGKELEATARARYELKNMEDMPPACATHPQYEICRASLDGWNQELKRILEIKCPKGESVITTALAGQVAEHYIPQVQYQLAVTGADECDFYVFHSETSRDALVKVKSDVAYQGQLIAHAIEFWTKYVLTDTPPPLTDKDVKVVEGNSELEKLAQAILKSQEVGPGPFKVQKISKEKLNALKSQFVQLGGHAKVRCGDVQVATVNRNGKFSYHKLTLLNQPEEESQPA